MYKSMNMFQGTTEVVVVVLEDQLILVHLVALLDLQVLEVLDCLVVHLHLVVHLVLVDRQVLQAIQADQ